MVHELTSHKVNGLNEHLIVEALDEPGPGNACHVYEIGFKEPEITGDVVNVLATIVFQQGSTTEKGLIGISIESLLAIVEHRLIGFQSGEFSCRENAVALTKIQEAMMWLQKRTRERTARGVEGKSKV